VGETDPASHTEIRTLPLILEIKAVSTILPIHGVQLRTYLRMSGIHVGLLLNFNVPRLVDGLGLYVV